MSSVSQRFTQFLSNIQLTDKQIEDAITKHNGVRKTLHNAYYSTQYILSTKEYEYTRRIVKSYLHEDVEVDNSPIYYTSLLVGSYGKRTAIAPPSDIDILFIMPPELFSRYNSYSSNGQSQLLQDVKNKLLIRYPNTSIKADGQVVMVPFNSYAIEVVPAFKTKNDYFLYPDTHTGGSWRHTNPRAEITFIRDSNKQTNGNTVRLIKMLKAWKLYCNVPIKSLVIELRAGYFLSRYEHASESPMYYDWMIRDFLKELLLYANRIGQIPGIAETIDYGDKWVSKTQTALSIAEKACEYERDNYPFLATDEWKKIFGKRFPALV